MVPIRLFHGPLRDAVAPGADLQGPFFSIVPRALVGYVAHLEAETGLAWPAVAPLLDAALSTTRSEAALGPWLDFCIESKVLNWCASAAACEAAVARLMGAADDRLACDLLDPAEWESVDCWQVKEGHTSSVWQMSIALRGDGNREVRCINVARDVTAAEELRTTTSRLQSLRTVDPDHIARVDLIRTVEVSASRPLEATITVGEWIPGNEIHLVGEVPAARLVEIGWFLGGVSPSERRQRVFGRYVDSAELAEICAQLRALLDRHARQVAGGTRIELPAVALTEGDIVWTGDRMVVIAVSNESMLVESETWDRLRCSPAACLQLVVDGGSSKVHAISGAKRTII